MAIYYTLLNPYELAVADSHVTVIRPYKTYIVSEYLYYYFASNTVQSVIEDKSDGSTKQKELATKTVKSYLVPLPPFAEQLRIVQKIKSVTSIGRRKAQLVSALTRIYLLIYQKVGLGYVWKQSLIQAPLVEFMQRTGDKREYHSIEREKLANWLMMVLLITNYT